MSAISKRLMDSLYILVECSTSAACSSAGKYSVLRSNACRRRHGNGQHTQLQTKE